MRKVLCLSMFLCVILFWRSPSADIIESRPVGPGIFHHHEHRTAGPWHLHVLEIDITNPWVRLETAKANDRLAGYERTSSMAGRNDREAHRVVGAVNGDFYASGGIPIGTQVLDGVLLKEPYAGRSVFGVTTNRAPLIDPVWLSGWLISADGESLDIDGINETRLTDALVLYNKYYGTTTGTNYWGTEVLVEYVDDPLVGEAFRAMATAKDSLPLAGHGNNPIPSAGLVLSGHGLSRDFLNEHVFIGDTLSLLLKLNPVPHAIAELIGGGPRLIRDGAATVESVAEGFGQSFASDRHPRTAVGFSPDSTKVFFFAVDGRQPEYSVGMSLYELADYMLEWGISQGANLDGGGSTTMVVRSQVVNSPSDAGGERTVANALLAISTAPTGPLTLLRIDPGEAYVLVETQLQFSAQGFDQYYNPLIVPPDSLIWSCRPGLGSIDQNGLFTAGEDQGSGCVYVTAGNILDSALVYITDIASIDLQPDPVILEVGEQQAITTQARDAYDNIISLQPSDYDWSVSGDMGEISSVGLFTATQPGDGLIVAAYRAVAGSTFVSVGTPTDIILDQFADLASWSLTGTLVDLPGCSFSLDSSVAISPPSAGRLHYSLQTGGTSALYLNCSIPISGTPDAIGIHVWGDGHGHWLRGEFQDVDQEKFLLNFTDATPGIDWSSTWQYLEAPLEEAIVHWANPSAVLSFPITWKKIYLAETDDAAKDSGTVFLDDFTASFIATEAEDRAEATLPQKFCLEQNYPNPFNPVTHIPFHLPAAARVRLDIYNTLGQHVDTLLNEYLPAGDHRVAFDAQDLASGIYLCRIQAEGIQETRKMVLIR